MIRVHAGLGYGSFKMRGPQYRPQNTTVLITGTPKIVNFGKPPTKDLCVWGVNFRSASGH